MNKKLLGIVLVIVGLIALIGAGFFVYIAVEFSTAMGMLSSADPAILAATGLEVTQLSTITSTVQTVLIVCFVWLITVIISALYAIYSGISLLRKK